MTYLLVGLFYLSPSVEKHFAKTHSLCYNKLMEQFTTRNLPISIQSFADVRERECVYVDKTQFIPSLLSTGKQYFLSRPRRFGKSLFLSTLKAYFLGKKDLFAGLALETLEPELAKFQKRDAWICRPVFHLDLCGQTYNRKEALENIIKSHLDIWEKEIGISPSIDDIAVRFRELIRNAAQKSGHKAVVLVDEYDKPLLDSIFNEELLGTYRTILKGFYGTLKPLDEYLHFVFITGITRFDKVSIFSDFNQLQDISNNEFFANICGITQSELEKNFQPEIKVMAEKNEMTYDECVAALKQKYDGYHFHKTQAEDVYNPFSLINAMSDKEFGNYWFVTGTPTFLVKMLKTMRIDAAKFVNGIEVDGRKFENYHIDTTSPEPLLYQSGYLTIKGYDREWRTYTLGLPNDEVKYGFFYELLPFYLQDDEVKEQFLAKEFARDVKNGNVDGFMNRVKAIFAALPQKSSEKFYELDAKQIFFLIFKLMGEFILCEIQNGDGRSDAVVWTENTIYVFEFKLDGTTDDALAQIDDKHYAIAYQADGRKVIKVGATFSSTEKNITAWKCITAE